MSRTFCQRIAVELDRQYLSSLLALRSNPLPGPEEYAASGPGNFYTAAVFAVLTHVGALPCPSG